MIVPFWSWNLSDTTHVRPHTKFQLVWAINTVFTRGGHNVPPPSLKCVAGTPSLLGLNTEPNCVVMRTQKLSPSDLKTHIRHPNTLLPASCQPPCQPFCVKQQPTFHCRCRGSGEWNCGIVNGGIYPHCTWLFINSILCEFAL